MILFWYAVISFSAPIDPTPRSLGVSGAYRAIADDASAFETNPAGISRHSEYRRLYASSRFYSLDKTDAGDSLNWGLNTSIIDGITEDPLHWGFSFDTTRSNPLKLQKYSLATSLNIKNIVLVGLGHRFFQFNRTIAFTPEWIFGMDLGVLAFPLDFLSVGAVVKNFVRSKNDSNKAPVEFGGGAALNLKRLRLAFDIEKNYSRAATFFMSGLEFSFTPISILRGGYYQDRTHSEYGYSVGMSVSPDPKFGMDLGFVDQLKSDYMVFSAGIALQL